MSVDSPMLTPADADTDAAVENPSDFTSVPARAQGRLG